MKKLILLFGLCAVLSSCEKPLPIGDEYVELSIKNYVGVYVDQPQLMERRDASLSEKNELVLKLSLACEDENRQVYVASEFGLNQNSEKFLEVAARNGDMGYTESRMWLVGSCGPVASAENYRSIDVVCSSAAWDDAHPAGMSLNDLVRISCWSYGDFVMGGYDKTKEYSCWYSYKPVTELSETGLYMLGTSLTVYIGNYPTKKGKYDLRITLTTVDGVERSLTHSFRRG